MAIVVGVDGSPGSEVAVRWALAEARVRALPVRLVHAWSLAIGGHAAVARTLALLEAASQALVDRTVACARAEAPDIEIEGVLVRGSPVGALVEASETAALVVVGTRGHGRVTSLLLGSVAEGCVRHCRCPVVVVPPGAEVEA